MTSTLLPPSAALAVAVVVAVGFLSFVSVAWGGRGDSWRLGNFFLGGRNIGARLTEHATWGTSFAFANGLFYFAFLGYQHGMVVVWLQIPWFVSLLVFAALVPRILRETRRFTIHGFLGDLYGGPARFLSSLVTTVGFLGALAFEIYVSVSILASAFALPESILEPTVIAFSLILAVCAAAYCDVGGFGAAARTDARQNIMGVIGVIFLAYIAIRMADESLAPVTLPALGRSLFDTTTLIPLQIAGILTMATTINLVDMSNWQNIAANCDSADDRERIRKLQRGIVKAAAWMLLFPAFFGVFLGYRMQAVKNLPQEAILGRIIAAVLPEPGFMGGLFVGLVVLALLATALSTADSYLMASIQTLSWDVRDQRVIAAYADPVDIPENVQRDIVSRSRRRLYFAALLSTGLFAWIAVRVKGVFELQFVIFGLVLALVPTTLLGLWMRHRGTEPGRVLRKAGLASIALGYAAGVVPFLLWWRDQELPIYAVSPIATLTASTVVLAGGIVASRILDGKALTRSQSAAEVGSAVETNPQLGGVNDASNES